MSDPQIETPLFQAHGFVMGVLERSEQGDTLVLSDGQRLPASGIHYRLKHWFGYVPPDDQPKLWGMYPRTHTDGTVSHVWLCQVSSTPQPQGFTISGQVVYCAKNMIVMCIHRNATPPEGQAERFMWQPFKIALVGCLPELSWQEHWRIRCELKDGKLVVIDGVKVLDAPTRLPRAKKAKQPPKPVRAADSSAPPPPILKSAKAMSTPDPAPRPPKVFDLSRR